MPDARRSAPKSERPRSRSNRGETALPTSALDDNSFHEFRNDAWIRASALTFAVVLALATVRACLADVIVVGGDSRSYQFPVWRGGARPPALTTMFWSLGERPGLIVALQLLVHVAAIVTLAYAIWNHMFPSMWLRRVSVIAVFAYGTATPLYQWSLCVLSESLANSALLFAIALLALQSEAERSSLRYTGGALAALLFAAHLRPSYHAAVFGALVLAPFFIPSFRSRRGLTVLGGFAIASVLSVLLSQFVHERPDPASTPWSVSFQEMAIGNVIGRDIRSDPGRYARFRREGMPSVPSNLAGKYSWDDYEGFLTPAMRKWIRDRGTTTVIKDAIAELPRGLATVFGTSRRTFGGNHFWIYFPRDGSRLLVRPIGQGQRVLDDALFSANAVTVPLLVAGLFAAAVRRRSRRLLLMIGGPLLIASWLSYYLDAAERDRHMFLGALGLRTLAFWGLLDCLWLGARRLRPG